MRVRLTEYAAGLACLGLACSALAATDGTTAASPPATQGAVGLEEVVVTAERKAESIQEVPLVVTAVSGESLNKLQIREMEDIAALVPGLTLTANANGIATTATIRGINYDGNTATNPAVEFYYNDTPAGGGNFLFQTMYDIGQIEVLHGPQGTLRGESSPAGSVTITTHRPDLSAFGGYVNTTVTDLGGQNVNGAVNLPLIDGVLAVRIAGLNDQNQGNRVTSITAPNVQPSEKTQSGRVTVLWEPVDSFTALLSFTQLNKQSAQFNQVESLSSVFGPGAPASPVTINAAQRLSNYPTPEPFSQVFQVTTANLDWTVLGQKITYDGSYSPTHYTAFGPANNGDFFNSSYSAQFQDFGQATNTHSYVATHELRIASVDPLFGHLSYVAGGYATQLDAPTALISQTPILFGPASPATPGIINNTPIENLAHQREDSLFANLSYKVIDGLEISAGARHIYSTQYGALNIGNGLLIVPTYESAHPTIDNENIKYRFNEHLLAYVTSGSSWRPGSHAIGDFNIAPSPLETAFTSTGSERSRSYEVGVKTNWLDNRLTVDAAYYHQTYTNYTYRAPGYGVAYIDTTFNQATHSLSQNVGNFNFIAGVPLKVDGVDIDAAMRPNEHWYFDVTASFAEARMQNALLPCNATPSIPPTLAQLEAVVAPGQSIAACSASYLAGLAPLFNATAQTEYSQPVIGDTQGFARALVTYYGNSENDPTNPYDNVTAYALGNVYLGLRSPKGGWEASVYAKNITNTLRVLTRSGAPLTTNYNILATGVVGNTTYNGITTTAPREFGINVQYAFGSK